MRCSVMMVECSSRVSAAATYEKWGTQARRPWSIYVLLFMRLLSIRTRIYFVPDRNRARAWMEQVDYQWTGITHTKTTPSAQPTEQRQRPQIHQPTNTTETNPDRIKTTGPTTVASHTHHKRALHTRGCDSNLERVQHVGQTLKPLLIGG